MRVPKKPQPNLSKLRLLAIFLCAFAVGVYLYHGFQPIPVDAEQKTQLEIPTIGLSTPVEEVQRQGNTITAPEVIAGVYQENPSRLLLIGHSSTVFQQLHQVKLGDQITYASQTYTVQDIQTLPKAQINMNQILAPTETPTIVLMTCAGQHLSGHDYTHRLIIEAETTGSEAGL